MRSLLFERGSNLIEKEVREEICEIGRRLYRRNMVAANAGNISCRISNDSVLITPTMVSKVGLQPQDILKIDLDGKILRGNGSPSSETYSIHLPLLKSGVGINAVVHAHPVYTSAFLLTGRGLPRAALVEMEAFFDKIKLIRFTMPGSDSLANALLKNLKNTDAFLLANHGAVTLGANLTEAYYRMEALEHSSQILFLTRHIGKIRSIPQKEQRRFPALRKTVHSKFATPQEKTATK